MKVGPDPGDGGKLLGGCDSGRVGVGMWWLWGGRKSGVLGPHEVYGLLV